MEKEEIIEELMHISHGVREGMITEITAVEMVNQLLKTYFVVGITKLGGKTK